MKYQRAIFFAILATVLWGTHSVLGRHVSADIPAELVSAARLLVGFIALMTILLFKIICGKETSSILKIESAAVKPLFCASLFVALNLFLFHYGLKYTSANNAMVLESTAPIFMVFFSAFFFKEKIVGHDFLMCLISFIGIVCVVFSNHSRSLSLFGDSVELGAGITWALFIVFTKKLSDGATTPSHRIRNLMYMLLGAFVFQLPFIGIDSLFDFHPDWVVSLLYLGIFPTAIAFALWSEAASQLKPNLLAILFNLSVVFTIINAYIFLQETLTIVSYIGILLILGSITWMTVSASKVPAKGISQAYS